jgi:hypothetical protein
MLELWKVSVTGINLIPTMLIGLITLYWLSTIIGVLDFSLFDVDVDIDADVDVDVDSDLSIQGQGLFHAVLVFLNVDCIPLMIILSFVIMFLWAFTIAASLLPIKTGGFIAAGLLVPEFFLSIMCTKFITMPLRPLFKKINKQSFDTTKTVGRFCTLKNDVVPGKLGQAEIVMKDRVLVINVKVRDDLSFNKGDKALVIEKDADRDFYYIEQFELEDK